MNLLRQEQIEKKIMKKMWIFFLVRLRCNSHNKIVIQHTAFMKVWYVIQCAYKTLNFHYILLLFKSILNFNHFSFSPIVFFFLNHRLLKYSLNHIGIHS